MALYKALVEDKLDNNRIVTVRGSCASEKEFIQDLRDNGYLVNPMKVKKAELFDYITKYTDCSESDWETKEIPCTNRYWFTNKNGESVLPDYTGSENGAIDYAQKNLMDIMQDIYVNCGEKIIEVVEVKKIAGQTKQLTTKAQRM